MNPLKESIRFYARHIEALLLLSGVILLPFLLVHNVTINYVSFLAALAGAPVVSSFYNLFLMLVFLTVVQIVFVQYVKSQLEGEERPLRHAFRTFFENGFSVFLFGIVYALAGVSGDGAVCRAGGGSLDPVLPYAVSGRAEKEIPLEMHAFLL